MALYKDTLHVTSSTDAIFDAVNKPGTAAPRAGIYRCIVCGKEIVSEESNALPPQNHHQHAPNAGAIQWKLLVYAQHKGS